MSCESKKWLVLLLLLVANCMNHSVEGESQVPCLFIFGDSLSDDGNNNNLFTSSKSNYNPYGIDFPTGPTGRFTNGETAIDIISQLLGFENFIPPFANTSGSDILKGVNYASGAAGIRFESGKHLGDDISLGSQFANHIAIVSQIAAKLGGYDKAAKYLNECLYYVNIGSNDYINNYFLPQYYATSRIYTVEQYSQVLIDQLSLYLKGLHDFGARKYVVVGIGLIGCTPNAIATHKTNGTCVEEENAAAIIYNNKLNSTVVEFNDKFSADSKFIFINTTAGTIDSSLGFTVLNASCCQTSGVTGLCLPNQTPCPNRNEYVFWDAFHPTQAVNILTAFASYNASNLAYTYPMDIEQLVQSFQSRKEKLVTDDPRNSGARKSIRIRMTNNMLRDYM